MGWPKTKKESVVDEKRAVRAQTRFRGSKNRPNTSMPLVGTRFEVMKSYVTVHEAPASMRHRSHA